MAMTAILSTCGIQRGFHQVLLLETYLYHVMLFQKMTINDTELKIGKIILRDVLP